MFHDYSTVGFIALRSILQGAEGKAANSLEDCLGELRRLSLTDFNEVMLSMPNSNWPNLTSRLPSMPAPEEQAVWTGSSGRPLLQDTLSITRIIETTFRNLTGKTLRDARVLDYGCGFGRILRSFSYSLTHRICLGLIHGTDLSTSAGATGSWQR